MTCYFYFGETSIGMTTITSRVKVIVQGSFITNGSYRGVCMALITGFIVIDVDECSLDQHNCDQICANIASGFICICEDGYLLQNDNRTCKGSYIIL